MRRGLFHVCALLRVKGDWYGPADLPQDAVAGRKMTLREKKVEMLSQEVFSRGNQYLKGALSLEALPEGIHSFPEVCFIGGPNGGKSSLIAALCHNSKLGRPGAKPGSTRKVQFYMVGGVMALVDCPAYGNWVDVEDRRLSMARGVGMMFQYLALRSRANLRRVYWVMEASTSQKMFTPTPRDKELLRFLYTERIPFSIVLNKVDRYGLDDHNRIVCDAGSIYDFLGTTSVPILDTIAHPHRPQKHRNIDKLQKDIMLHITNQLRDDELTFKGLSSLGYMPFTAEEQQRVEERYPMRNIVLPHRDDISLLSFVDHHQQAKKQFIEFHRLGSSVTTPMAVLEKSTREGLMGFKDKMDDHLAEMKADAAQWEDRRLEHAQRLVWGQSAGELGPGGAAKEGPYLPNQGDVHDKLPASDAAIAHHAPNSVAESHPPSDTDARGGGVAISALGGVQPTSAALAAQTGPPPILSLPRGMAEAFPFKFIPESMISGTFERDLALADKRSFGALEEAQFDLTYDGIMNEEISAFLEESPDDQTPLSKRAADKKVFKKYLNQNQKPRYQNLTSAASMCPWVGSPKEGSVLGVSPDGGAVGAHSGSVIRNLRNRGFGGRSVSPYTLKQRGRATEKVGKWAR
jgi:GTP-binding protein EngB required for normal cell division